MTSSQGVLLICSSVPYPTQLIRKVVFVVSLILKSYSKVGLGESGG